MILDGLDLGLDPDTLTRDQRVEALMAVDRARSQAEALELKVLGAMDASMDFAADGALNLQVWLARRADMTGATAGSMVRDARKLRQHPDSLDACFSLGS